MQNSIICHVCLLMFLLVLAACQPQRADHSTRVFTQGPDISLGLTPGTVPVETPLRLQLVSRQPISNITADVTGVSMYMGVVPLRFQKLSTPDSGGAEQWQAEFLLGACSDPAMLWQLNVTVQFADGRKLSLKEQFNSSW
ncbi:hypothetical protein [Arsukibacterium indicum]|uniref:Lipoprotein n=1 Tax=Arsukibacterium indicum TaxID=2848612 RepID=A0ABS6MLQ7_9GAMM|nr:hypothetical protein [Arsukibacterium indicum]MBV2129732.1 hypothetical protein [Arsukibacterium indicum]